MDNTQMPPVQPVTPIQPSGGMPLAGGVGVNGGAMPNGASGNPGSPTANGMPMVQQIQLPPEQKKDMAGLVKTIVIVILAIVAVIFIGLFVWKAIDYNNLETDWETEKNLAVAQAEDAVRMEEAEKYDEAKKYPYETFTGPVDYGELSFEYPKTWSVYVSEPATTGGDFHAYLNPVQVDTVGAASTINALRVTITTQRYDEVIQSYQGQVDDPRIDFDVYTTDVVNAKTGQTFTVNRYEGTIPGSELSGYIVIFKIRDKTVILQTDSRDVFGEEFDKLLETVQFNE